MTIKNATHPATWGRRCSSSKVLLWSCNFLADSLTCSWRVQSFPLRHSPQASLAVSSPATSPWSSEDARSLLCVQEQPAIIETAGRQNRNTHAYYGFLWVWFIDRHVFSELCVIYNFLYFPWTPQLFCHNSIICSEQNPTNYGSARAFGAFTAVHRSIKKDKRAWVIAQALLLMPSPPHSLV